MPAGLKHNSSLDRDGTNAEPGALTCVYGHLLYLYVLLLPNWSIVKVILIYIYTYLYNYNNNNFIFSNYSDHHILDRPNSYSNKI